MRYYNRILTRLLNTPLAISQEKLDVITSKITLNLLAGESIPAMGTPTPTMEEEITPSIGVIKVYDALVSHNGAGDSGSTSYDSINSQIDRLTALGVTHIVFKISSPGGEVEGLFELANRIHTLQEEGIKTIAVATGNVTSAAYVIAASCSSFYATQASIVGSIGVIMTLANQRQADKKAGFEYIILRSKPDKAILNSHEKFTPDAIDKAEKLLFSLDSIMNAAVNSFRPSLSIEDIIKLKGDTVLGEEAASLNLIDGVVSSFQEVIDGIIISNGVVNSKTETLNLIGSNMTESQELLAMKEQLAAMQAQLAEQQNLNAKAEEVANTKALERVTGIITAAKTLGIPNAQLVAEKYISAGLSLQDATAQMVLLKETMQLANPSPTANGLDTALTLEVFDNKKEAYEDKLADRIAARGARLKKYAAFGTANMSDNEAIEDLFALVK